MKALIKKAAGGKRLTKEEGISIFLNSDLLSLGRAADMARKRLHPEGIVTFIVDRNINYTNVCVNQCKFCAFYRTEEDSESYLLPDSEIFQKVKETVEVGGTQILIQGGLHPKLDISYYQRLFSGIKERFSVNIHGLSPAEIKHIAKNSALTIREALLLLRTAGLGFHPWRRRGDTGGQRPGRGKP